MEVRNIMVANRPQARPASAGRELDEMRRLLNLTRKCVVVASHLVDGRSTSELRKQFERLSVCLQDKVAFKETHLREFEPRSPAEHREGVMDVTLTKAAPREVSQFHEGIGSYITAVDPCVFLG